MPGVKDAKVSKTIPEFKECTDQRGYRPQAIIIVYDKCCNTEVHRVPEGHQTRQSVNAS